MDIKNELAVTQSISPAGDRTSSVNGSSVDLAARHGLMVVFNVGTITDGTHTPKIQDSDDDSTFSDVAAADQVGTLSALVAATMQSVGYIGAKQFVRAVVTVTGGPVTGAQWSAVHVAGPPRKAPV